MLVVNLLLTSIIVLAYGGRVIDEDFQELINVKGPVKIPYGLQQAKQIGSVTIGHVMRIKFTLNIKSFPTDGWRGVLRIGNKNNYYPRLPGVWLYPQPSSKHPGLHISISNDKNVNPWLQIPQVKSTNCNYRVEILFTPSCTIIELNGKIVLKKIVPSMKMYYGKTYGVYIGDPMFKGSNGILSNIMIERLGPDFISEFVWANKGDKKIDNTIIGQVKISPSMRIRFNVRFNRIPTDTWRSVLKVGLPKSHYPRLPGVWISPISTTGLHVSVSHNLNPDPWTSVKEVTKINKEYAIEIIWTKKNYMVFVDGLLSVNKPTKSMSNYYGKTYPVMIGSPKWPAADGIVTDLEIDTLISDTRIQANNIKNNIDKKGCDPNYDPWNCAQSKNKNIDNANANSKNNNNDINTEFDFNDKNNALNSFNNFIEKPLQSNNITNNTPYHLYILIGGIIGLVIGIIFTVLLVKLLTYKKDTKKI